MTIFAGCVLAIILLGAGVCWYWRREERKQDRKHTGRDPKRNVRS